MPTRLPELPDDVVRWIFHLRSRDRGAVVIQTHWAGYRTRALVRRYRTLRGLRLFRDERCDVGIFVRQARL